MHHVAGTYRSRLIALLIAGGALAMAPAPALAVDSVNCAATGDPHAGREFTVQARTAPIVGTYTYRWDLDNDGTFESDRGSDANLRTERAAAGTYTFGVLVTDGDAAAGDPKREARGKCDVTVINDLPLPNFGVHPVGASFPTAYEATRFTFVASDNENDLNQVAMTHSIDFDGDGQFEFRARGDGEVYASFPAGFDKDVTHRVTDSAGGSVDSTIRIKPPRNAFGIGGTAVIAPLSVGTLPPVTARAPKSVKRKTLLKHGVVATFDWGATWGRVKLVPAIKKTTGFVYEGNAGYAPGQQLTVNRLPPALKSLIRRGAKKIELRWTARGQAGAEQQGKLVIRIKG